MLGREMRDSSNIAEALALPMNAVANPPESACRDQEDEIVQCEVEAQQLPEVAVRQDAPVTAADDELLLRQGVNKYDKLYR